MEPVPYADIDTIFLDVGNTLISIDFDRVAEELAHKQFTCAPEALRRAEAAARPAYSERVFVTGVPPHRSLFHWYLYAILEQAKGLSSLSPTQLDELVAEIGPILRPEGRASVLWRMVMPGVPAALERLQRQGLTLAVISNSDGTCAKSLEEAGLLRYLSFVIDSAEVGVEKPDPRIFEIALARGGADPKCTLYVGDLYHADVIGARGAGLHALLLDPYGDWPEMGCEKARDLSELAERTSGVVLAPNGNSSGNYGDHKPKGRARPTDFSVLNHFTATAVVYWIAMLFMARVLILGWFDRPDRPIYGLLVATWTFVLGPGVAIPVMRRVPLRWFRVSERERVIHRMLGVGVFGWLLNRTGYNRRFVHPMWGFSANRAGLPLRALAARVSVSAHGACFGIHLVLAVLTLFTRHPWGALWILGPGVVIHLYPVLLQRSIMLRLQPLLVQKALGHS